MTELKEVLMDIRHELRGAEKYAKEAVKHKEQYPELADTYHRIASDKAAHANMLAKHAKTMAEKNHMGDLWDIENYMIGQDMDSVIRCIEKFKE